MKRFNFILAIIYIVITSFSIFAQSAKSQTIEKIFEKYSGKDGFTVVNLNDPSELFPDKENPFSKQANVDIDLKGITGIKILTCEVDEKKGKTEGKAFKNDLMDLKFDNSYKEVLTVKEEDNYVKMLMKKGSKSSGEFVLIAISDDESTLIQIMGDIDLGKLKSMGKFLEGKQDYDDQREEEIKEKELKNKEDDLKKDAIEIEPK